MRKMLVAAVCVLVMAMGLAGCGTKGLVSMQKTTIEGIVGNVIEWDSYVYYSLGDIDDGTLRNVQIGYANNDQSDKIYSVKDQSTDKFLINSYDANGTTVNEVFMEKSVKDVPTAIENHLPEIYQINKTVNDDGRYISNGSGEQWNFVLDNDKMAIVTDAIAQNTGVSMGSNFDQYIGAQINVSLYDTLPSDGGDGLIRYVFVFSGNKQIGYWQLLDDGQAAMIEGVCNELAPAE